MSDTTIIFSMVGVSKTIPPNRQILKDIYLSFYYGAKIGIIGANGSGKSTLLRIIAGKDENYQGKIERSKDYTVGMLEQEPYLDPEKTVIDIVREGKKAIFDLLDEFNTISEQLSDPDIDADRIEKLLERQGVLQDKIDAAGAWEIDQVLNRAMDALQCPEPDALVKHLSGGERRRVALCRLLLQEPDVLLLDEPTNHLDAESVLWLEHHLAQYKGTVICVTHDRYFLDNVAGWILELDRGEGIPWKGNYTSWLEQKQLRLAQEEATQNKRAKIMQRELEWARMGQKARQAKGKARLANYEKMLQEDVKKQEEKLEIYIPPGPRLGAKVIEAKNVTKVYGDRVLFENLNFNLPQGGIVGVIGPNGAGKTTLFRMIMGLEKPTSGTFEIGETVKLSYVDQMHANIDPEKTVWEVISNGDEWIELGKLRMNSRGYVSRFNFNGADQQKKVKYLSGGERNRLHLALTLREEANVLLLDEPTNDLDVNTIRALEEALENYAGCAVIISHDRWFLDRVCTHILAFEGEGRVYYFEGSFSDYEENRRQRMGISADEPRRFKYKKLVA
ncbi:MAG: energy-dependent translational throttle protein EttA [Chitinophagales bacterium]|nr:energy-dependent translational throttle protein EttA [Chitinophagales bacterium]MDW8419268.1 energy-dependent translational throttle protein EttA [Chitinophagales bacterium]